MTLRVFLFIAILFAIDLYAFQAFKVLSRDWTASLRTILFIVYWGIFGTAVTTLLAASFTDVSQWNKSLFTVLRAVLLIAYFSKLLVVVFVLLDDIRRFSTAGYAWLAGSGAYDPSRSKFLSQMAIFMGGLPFAALTYGILRNPYRYKVYRTTLELENLPEALEGLKIVQISDIHSGSFFMKEPVKLSVDMINRENADLVFFTGDLVNNIAAEIEPYIDIFKEIKSKNGVFSVLGNHDYGDYESWASPDDKRANMVRLEENQKKLGWDLLKNENRILEINGEKVAVIGVENYSAIPRFPKHGNLVQAYAGAENAPVKLLLSHDPSHWDYEVTSKFPDIDVTFSGHTHGFQFGIEIPGIFRWSPSQYMYKQWAGLYQQGKQYLYVNRGLGFLGYPGRVGILPEITSIELRRKSPVAES